MGFFSKLGSLAGAAIGTAVAGPAGTKWGAAIGSGAGGFLDGKTAKKSDNTTRSSIDFVALRNGAEAAGFNPLTALRATGGAGNVVTTGPSLAGPTFMAQAMGAAADAWDANDPIKLEREQLETDILREELERMKRQNGVSKVQKASPQVVKTAGAALSIPGAVEVAPRTQSDPRDQDSDTYLDPRVVDAGVGAARYGEIYEEIAGGSNLIRDNLYNGRLQRVLATYGREVSDAIHAEFTANPRQDLGDLIAKHTSRHKKQSGQPKGRHGGRGTSPSGPFTPPQESTPWVRSRGSLILN